MRACTERDRERERERERYVGREGQGREREIIHTVEGHFNMTAINLVRIETE